ncbi:MAG: hypothetical protein Q7T51_01910 [Candidatus Moranbacteria bacterium]|nr:hypothetical protein [Candidatus Moranbacteria bacterium]
MEKEQVQFEKSELGEIQIKIPETGGSVTVEDVKKEADSKFKDINYILLSVVIILLVMVSTLIIDSFHINSAIYKEYSEKTGSVEQSQKINQELLDQNQKNQQLILEQQKQIQELIKKK